MSLVWMAGPAGASVGVETVELDATLVPSVNKADSVSVVDMDGDGMVDLVVPSRNGGVSLQRGLGGGRFAAPVQVAHPGGGLSDSVVSDFDGDGLLDVAVGQAKYGGFFGVRVLRGIGEGDLEDKGVAYPTPSAVREVRVADLNGDGDPDLLAASPWSDLVNVLLGVPGPGFTMAAPIMVGDLPGGFSVAHINGDGQLDVAVANRGSNTVSLRYGDGAGAFPTGAEVATRPAPQDAEVTDLNGDGLPDLVVGSNADPASEPGSLAVLKGSGPAQFDEIRVYQTAPFIRNVNLADIDNDGHVDAVIGSGNNGAFGTSPSAPGYLTVVSGVPGSTDHVVVAKCGSAAGDVAIADLDGDGDLDVISTRGLFYLAALFDPLG